MNGFSVGRIDEFSYYWFLYTSIYSLDSHLYVFLNSNDGKECQRYLIESLWPQNEMQLVESPQQKQFLPDIHKHAPFRSILSTELEGLQQQCKGLYYIPTTFYQLA